MTSLSKAKYQKLFTETFQDLKLESYNKKIVILAAFDQYCNGDWPRDSNLYDAIRGTLKYRKFSVWNIMEGAGGKTLKTAINIKIAEADIVFVIFSLDTVSVKQHFKYLNEQINHLVELKKKFCLLQTDKYVDVPIEWQNYAAFDMSNKEDLIKFVEFVNTQE